MRTTVLVVALLALAVGDVISDAEAHLDDPLTVDIAPALRAAVSATAAGWPVWAIVGTTLGALFAACALGLLLYGAVLSTKTTHTHALPPDAFFIAGAVVLVLGCALIVVPVTLVLTAAAAPTLAAAPLP